MDTAKAELLGFLAAEGNEYHYLRRYARFFKNRGPAGKWYSINYSQHAIEFTNVEPVLQNRFYQLLVMTYGGQKAHSAADVESAFGERRWLQTCCITVGWDVSNGECLRKS